MHIFYFIDPVSGNATLQHSPSNEGERIQAFIEKVNLPSCEIINVDTDAKAYTHEDAQKDLAKHLWEQLGNIPTIEGKTDRMIDEPFLHFIKGTDLYEIWHWFESEFNLSVASDLMGFSLPF